jgi:NAD(P)-dependent dehydrogenase (short-subunit alcohol dehydrogenase family)
VTPPPETSPVALVTNGTFGLGAEIARTLTRSGARVAVADSGRHGGDGFRRDEAEKPASIHHGRITSPADCERVVKEVTQQHGQLDVLVWTDVVRMGLSCPVERMGSTEWDDVMAAHLSGPAYLIQAALPTMLAQGSGRIINVISGSGTAGGPGLAHLSAATAGLLMFIRRLAREVAPRQVTANSVLFGMVSQYGWVPDDVLEQAINLVPAGRLGEPGDVAGLVAFLAGPQGGYITGQSISVDGGLGV